MFGFCLVMRTEWAPISREESGGPANRHQIIPDWDMHPKLNPMRWVKHDLEPRSFSGRGRLLGILLTAAFTFFFSQLSAQSPTLDSGRQELSELKGKERLAAMVELVNRIENRWPQEALVFAKEGLELAKQEGDREKQAAFLSSMGFCCSQTGDFILAIQYGKESLELSKSINNKYRIAQAHNTLGIIYTFMGVYSQALEEHLESLRIREELSLDTASFKSLNNIGVLYHNMGQYEKSIEYYQKMHQKLEKNPNDSNLILIKLNTGFAQYKLGKLSEALKNHEEALELISKTDNKTLLAYAFMNLGMTFTDLKDFDKASYFLSLSLDEYQKQDQKHGRVQALNALGRMYMLTGAYAKAIPCALEAANLAKNINSKNELIVSYLLVSDLYKHQGDIEKSYAFFKLYAETKDSIHSTQESYKTADLLAKMVTLKKDNEIESLKKEKLIASLKIEKNKYNTLIFITSIVFMVIIIVVLARYSHKIRANKLILEKANFDLGRLNTELNEKIHEIKTLTGLLPICAQCKKIRNDQGYWEQLEGYISQHSAATFTHGICPHCAEEFFPEAMQQGLDPGPMAAPMG